MTPSLAFARALRGAATLLLAWAVSACAALPGHEPVRVNVVGFEPLPSEGLEIRFAVKLRVMNPNDTPVSYDGVSLAFDVAGNTLANGVSAAKGDVPRFGEAVFSVPVSISALAAVRQALGLARGESIEELPFRLRGRLAAGALGGMSFSDEGVLRWSQVSTKPAP
jgi:LEA14-like dessication related protein